jgi:nucleoredoxin
MRASPLVFALFLAASALGAPINMKELEFLLRQQTPEAQIISEVTERRLLAPIDDAAAKALKSLGASESLLAALRKPELVMSAREAQSELQRQEARRMEVERALQSETEAFEARKKRDEQIATHMRTEGNVRQMLEGKLVRLSGDQVKPADSSTVRDTKLFAFYYSAMWCGPCRRFTPELVKAYERIKKQYPDQFELIFVSSDRDEFNMTEYMRTYRMPWPAVRFDAKNAELMRFAGDGIPWLVAVAGSGQALTKNGVDKKYIDPNEALQAIEYLLANMKK